MTVTIVTLELYQAGRIRAGGRVADVVLCQECAVVLIDPLCRKVRRGVGDFHLRQVVYQDDRYAVLVSQLLQERDVLVIVRIGIMPFYEPHRRFILRRVLGKMAGRYCGFRFYGTEKKRGSACPASTTV